jgi:hypothetical protein
VKGAPRSNMNTSGDDGSCSRLSRRRADPAQGVNGWRAVLGAAHMDLPMAEVDSIPAQRQSRCRAVVCPLPAALDRVSRRAIKRH